MHVRIIAEAKSLSRGKGLNPTHVEVLGLCKCAEHPFIVTEEKEEHMDIIWKVWWLRMRKLFPDCFFFFFNQENQGKVERGKGREYWSFEKKRNEEII